ncbi:MAG: hypothetical protein IKW39_03415 [Alphaproteobacteria bacterium]|nr:hypothetical protein [Alphaproteobacteria bacterium]
MNKRHVFYSIIIGAEIFFAPMCYANSYLTMITTKPDNYEPYTPKYPPIPQKHLYYNSNTVTNSPVVTDPTHKIQAWARSKEHPYDPITLKENMQNIILTVETIALGGLIFLMHKH